MTMNLKVATLLSALALAAAAGAARAEEPVDEQPSVSAAGTAKETVQNSCAICHGADGVARWGYIPSLAGQNKDFIVDQLKGMREHKRTTRYSRAAMWGMAGMLTDGEIDALADYYSKLDPSKGHAGETVFPFIVRNGPAYQKKLELGKTVFERREAGRPSCTTCHFGGQGNTNLPRLAGQHAEYVARSLHDFQRGFRINGTMSYMAAKLTEDEVQGVATYVASLDVPKWAAPDQNSAEAGSIERGHDLFQKVGCYQCHGEDGKGGVSNPNAVGGLVPTLTAVSQGYNDTELKNKIRMGVRYVAKADPNGPTPPLFMPTWGSFLTGQQLDDLVAYLKSLSKGQPSQGF
jgi:cytochrome c553